MTKRKEGVTPSKAPQGEGPSAARVDWKARAASYERKVGALEGRCAVDSNEIARLGKLLSAANDHVKTLQAKVAIMTKIAEVREERIEVLNRNIIDARETSNAFGRVCVKNLDDVIRGHQRDIAKVPRWVRFLFGVK